MPYKDYERKRAHNKDSYKIRSESLGLNKGLKPPVTSEVTSRKEVVTSLKDKIRLIEEGTTYSSPQVPSSLPEPPDIEYVSDPESNEGLE